jgi:hypothetical protein
MYLQPEEEQEITEEGNEELLQVDQGLKDMCELDNESIGHEKEQLRVKGNLKRHIQFWRDIRASQFILRVIEEGYRFPFQVIPAATILRKNKSAEHHKQFVQEAITELVNTGRMIQVDSVPQVVNPLSVAVQLSGKKRLILDLRYVNKCLLKVTSHDERAF